MKLPYLDANRDTGHFVRGLIRNPPGKHMLGVNTELTQEEFMKLWTETLGVTGSVEEGTLEELTGALPPPLDQELFDSFSFVREYGWTGGDESVVMPKEVRETKVWEHFRCPFADRQSSSELNFPQMELSTILKTKTGRPF